MTITFQHPRAPVCDVRCNTSQPAHLYVDVTPWLHCQCCESVPQRPRGTNTLAWSAAAQHTEHTHRCSLNSSQSISLSDFYKLIHKFMTFTYFRICKKSISLITRIVPRSWCLFPCSGSDCRASARCWWRVNKGENRKHTSLTSWPPMKKAHH